MPQKELRDRPNATRTSNASFGRVIIILLLVLGAINFADKAVLGLAAVPIIMAKDIAFRTSSPLPKLPHSIPNGEYLSHVFSTIVILTEEN